MAKSFTISPNPGVLCRSERLNKDFKFLRMYTMKQLFFQIMRFGVIGVVNMLLDAVIYSGLTGGFVFFEQYYLLAAFLAFVISSTSSFFMNKRWTFKDSIKLSHRQLLMFYGSSALGLFVNEFVLWISVEFIGLQGVAPKIVASLSAAGVNFFLQKFLVFRKREIQVAVIEDSETSI